jgi:hypothetical protein
VRLFAGLLVVLMLAQGPGGHAEEPTALERAHRHYEAGVSLFESGNKEQALVEFELANEVAPKKENVFMIAQCEYHLGHLVRARTHYHDFLAEQPHGELADLARLRIEAINRRPGVFAINTVPDQVDIRIVGEGKFITGQAPNEFSVPRGHYHVTASKPNYGRETRELSIEVAETKPLFFKLEAIPAHLTVRTVPAGAALFVRGNRTQNPYVQDVPPGMYEIYAEAPYYQSRRDTIVLAPGESRVVEFPLTYVQRSGRPELIGFWTGMGALGGGLAVLTQQPNPSTGSLPLSVSLLSAGVLAGGLGLGVLSSTTPLVPSYIRDNLALFRIGAMWIGDVEGATLAMGLTHSWTATFMGGIAGLTGGAITGWWLDDKSPNYGRVSVIQSAAVLGTVAGAIAVPALGWYPKTEEADYRNHQKQRLAWGMLAGLNVGLGVGLAMAYLPDQRAYGPSWQRAIMVDLAGVAGAVFATTVELCSRGEKCATNQNAKLGNRTAQFALVGAGAGLVAGWLLTMNFDRNNETQTDRRPLSFLPLPMPGVVPVQSVTGTPELLPGLLSHGTF